MYSGSCVAAQVYKGHLKNGTTIAVKKLDRQGMQGDKEYAIEVNLLYTLRHPNIVSLLGICNSDDHRLAVFEFAPKVLHPPAPVSYATPFSLVYLSHCPPSPLIRVPARMHH